MVTTGQGKKGLWGGLSAALSRSLAVLLLLQLMNGIMMSPQRTFFPLYMQSLGHPVLLISALASAQQVMGLLGAWFGGALSDALGRKRALLLGQAGSLLAGMIFLRPSLGWLAPLWVLSGFCGGVHTVAGQSYLVDAAQVGYLGLLTAFYNWGSTAGGALGSPAAGALLDRWGYPAFGLALVLFAGAALTVNLLALPRDHATGQTARGRFLGYGEIARRPTALILAMLRFLPTFYWGMASILIPLLLNAAGASKTLIALYATTSQVCASVAQIAAGRAADRLGVKGVALVAYSLLILSILGLGLFPAALMAVWLCGVLSTMAAWSLSTMMPSLVAHVTRAEERGRMLGWVHLWWNLGMVLGSLAGGALFRLGAGLPFLLAGTLNLGAVALVFVFFRLAGGERP